MTQPNTIRSELQIIEAVPAPPPPDPSDEDSAPPVDEDETPPVEPIPEGAITRSVNGAEAVLTDAEVTAFVASQPGPLVTVPVKVTNFQGRTVMRHYPMADGRSLFSHVDDDLRQAVAAVAGLPEFDPVRVEVELQWQAWERANHYYRHGPVTALLMARYPITPAIADALFIAADTVDA